MKIEPLLIPQINWDQYISVTENLLDYSVIRPLDAEKQSISSLGSFLATLFHFGHPGASQTTFKEALQLSGRLQEHLSCTFLVECTKETIDYLLRHTDLRITSIKTNQNTSLNVISGTLSQWFVATINLCQEHVDKEARLFGGVIVLLFEKLELTAVWRDYRKNILPDNSFVLTKKG